MRTSSVRSSSVVVRAAAVRGMRHGGVKKALHVEALNMPV